MKRFLYTIGIACSIFNSQLSIAQSTYTLEQILDSARHNNITLRNAQRSVDAAEQQRKEAFPQSVPLASASPLIKAWQRWKSIYLTVSPPR